MKISPAGEEGAVTPGIECGELDGYEGEVLCVKVLGDLPLSYSSRLVFFRIFCIGLFALSLSCCLLCSCSSFVCLCI